MGNTAYNIKAREVETPLVLLMYVDMHVTVSQSTTSGVSTSGPFHVQNVKASQCESVQVIYHARMDHIVGQHDTDVLTRRECRSFSRSMSNICGGSSSYGQVIGSSVQSVLSCWKY
jgi:hypothetical protein